MIIGTIDGTINVDLSKVTLLKFRYSEWFE